MALESEQIRLLNMSLDSTPYSARWRREISASEYDQLRILVFKLHQAITTTNASDDTTTITESRLRMHGYVNRRETPRSERCSALRNAINSGMDPQEIINFLRYLIHRNIDRRSMQDALNRYQDDIQWIESNYLG